MRRSVSAYALLASVACTVAACGGGGGGGANSTPPPQHGGPPPPPPPPSFANIFPNITTDTDLAVLGLQAGALGIPASSLVSSGFAVRFDAARDAYVIDLPSQLPGRFAASSDEFDAWYGHLVDDVGNRFDEPSLNVRKPTPYDLEYTTFATFYDYDFYDYDGDGQFPSGAFAFGNPTASSAIPTTGSAIFDAIVAGFTLDTGREVDGTASLQFDFAVGTLAGSFSPFTYSDTARVGLGTYNFVNTVFGVGSTTFSGQLQHAGTSDLGAFNGLFTGPAAQELMSRWTAPYLNPDNSQWSEMYGIWVGRRP